MNNNIEIQHGIYGPKAVIKSKWHESFLDEILSKEVKELEINDGKGWNGDDVNFLKYLPELESLTLIDLTLKSVEPVHFLENLIRLELITYSKTPVFFGLFPKLLDCGFEWITGSDSLFERRNLKKLYINNLKKNDSSIFSSLANLQHLSILNSKLENLHGIFSLKNLLYLRLANLNKVTSIKDIGNLSNLEELEIQRCKHINSIYDIFNLFNLKRLLLLDMGDIESIIGLESLVNLESFLFYESTNIVDGNISPLLKLNNLANISFKNRKHYTHKREDFGALYIQKTLQ
ncbi:hypothetical protein GO755_20520 [Spirosoma sp. HMF4905]|uniref:Leucine-rich repeat domain-containing protein n=1 Tax=Spirosoma arboris TaxID=2682092 RepID=A0A7K1SF79_9BACT|nr:hypothetical protein [Spirosoma arboris]MVM32441.1 hypothetical protein [Spirosoma arboris]